MNIDLRDYFAGQALAGMMADSGSKGIYEQFAQWAYKYADAMIAEKAKTSKDGGGGGGIKVSFHTGAEDTLV